MSVTPDGNKYDPVDPANIGDCWISSTSYRNLAKYAADPEYAPYLNQTIIDACAAVNAICRRKFNKQTIDQIFKDQPLVVSEYLTFALDNPPLEEVTNMWIQNVNVFAAVDLGYIQDFTREGIIKVMPKFFFTTYAIIPPISGINSTNLWVRYIGGYDAADVPADVKRATAMMVDYLFGIENVATGIKSFRTQTYSQENATASDDPKLSLINNLLKRYIKNKLA